MAREVTRYEAATDPPTTHATLKEAVAHEVAAQMGWRQGGDGAVIALARELTKNAGAVIDALKQLPAPEQAATEGNSDDL